MFGFTPQEYKVIEELLKVCKDIYVTICANDLNLEKTDANSDIFYSNKVTANKLIKIAMINNIEIKDKIHLNNTYRFKSNELKYLEENIYSNIYERFEDNPKDINLFLAKNPYSEVEYVANKIIQNVMENRI